jgi:hypothetical protein
VIRDGALLGIIPKLLVRADLAVEVPAVIPQYPGSLPVPCRFSPRSPGGIFDHSTIEREICVEVEGIGTDKLKLSENVLSMASERRALGILCGRDSADQREGGSFYPC